MKRVLVPLQILPKRPPVDLTAELNTLRRAVFIETDPKTKALYERTIARIERLMSPP